MDNSCTGYYTAEDHIHTDITTFNTEETQQKYRLGTVSERLLGVAAGCLKAFLFYTLVLPFISLRFIC